jgi:hypothetical protein
VKFSWPSTSSELGKSISKGSTNGLEGFPTHEDGVAEGGALEKREVFGEVPGEFAVCADEAVGIHGDNGCGLKSAFRYVRRRWGL